MRRIIPRDVFGEAVNVGERIVYITGSHGYTIINWAEVLSITWKCRPYNDFETFTIKARKYAEDKGWRKWADGREEIVFLTAPTIIKVGQLIPEKP